MKKSLFLFVASALVMASCSNDELVSPSDNDGNVTFTVNLPGVMGSRSFADGLTADDLEMAVYDATNDAYVFSPPAVTFGKSLSTTVSLNLANGRSYKIAFFAHKKSTQTYTFNAEAKTISVDYTKMNADYNTDNHDCFYELYETGTITGPLTRNVTLTRPVAQINWGTSDHSEPAVVAADNYGTNLVNLVSKVTTKAYTTFNMLDKDVDMASEQDVNLAYLACPDKDEAFPAKPKTEGMTYRYLSMQYLLVPKASSVLDLTLEVANDAAAAGAQSTVKVTNAPVQANYRTNIFGALLTTPEAYIVTKHESFDNEYDYPVWNGKIVTVEADADGNLPIANAEQLAWLATQPKDAFAGKTIYLTEDINLVGSDWKSIEVWSPEPKVTFDGRNHTISGLTAPLFSTFTGDIANLTVKDVKIENTNSSFQAGVVGTLYGNVTNVHAVNVVIKADPNGAAKIRFGAIIGLHNSGNVTGCTVDKADITAYHNVGGITGTVNEAKDVRTYTNCKVTNSVLNHTVASGSGLNMTGAIVGNNNRSAAINFVDCVIADNNVSNMIGTGPYTISGKTAVSGYPNLFADENGYYAYDAKGLKEMFDYINKNGGNNTFFKKAYNIESDIDCAGIALPHSWMSASSNNNDGIVLNGNNHVIRNIKMDNGGLFGGAVGGNNGAPCKVNDLTIENAEISGGFHVGVFGGNFATNWEFSNVAIRNSKVTGSCNVGAFLGSTGEIRANVTVKFTNCKVEGCTLEATGGVGVDPTGASAFIGRALHTAAFTTTVTLDNSTASENEIINAEGMVGGGLYGYTTYNNGFRDTGIQE